MKLHWVFKQLKNLKQLQKMFNICSDLFRKRSDLKNEPSFTKIGPILRKWWKIELLVVFAKIRKLTAF